MSLSAVLVFPLLIIFVLVIPAGIAVYLRYAGLPRYGGPVFPAGREEAERVYRHWRKHNQECSLYADVRLPGGSVIRDVSFDPDSFCAVEVDGNAVPVWLYRQAIDGILVLGEGLSEAERGAFAESSEETE